jgi:hypothetical protein|tara:strand:- start:22928 stop:23098 length:171 start_codon:yes stop_codon:yes gene_type:complete
VKGSGVSGDSQNLSVLTDLFHCKKQTSLSKVEGISERQKNVLNKRNLKEAAVQLWL